MDPEEVEGRREDEIVDLVRSEIQSKLQGCKGLRRKDGVYTDRMVEPAVVPRVIGITHCQEQDSALKSVGCGIHLYSSISDVNVCDTSLYLYLDIET